MTNWNWTDLDAAYEIEEKRAHRQQRRAKLRRCLPLIALACVLALCLALSGCAKYVSENEVDRAIRFCLPHGGLKYIDTGMPISALCANSVEIIIRGGK